MISDFDARQKWGQVAIILLYFSVYVVKLVMMFRVASNRYDPEMKKALKAFGLMAFRRWFWLVMWLLISTSCACGACMVMMHDGMDFSFTFKQWYGTWPFLS